MRLLRQFGTELQQIQVGIAHMTDHHQDEYREGVSEGDEKRHKVNDISLRFRPALLIHSYRQQQHNHSIYFPIQHPPRE